MILGFNKLVYEIFIKKLLDTVLKLVHSLIILVAYSVNLLLVKKKSYFFFFFSQIEISFIVKIPNSYKLIGPNKPDLKPTTRHPRSGNPKTRSTPTDSGAAQTPTHHRTSFTTQGILPRKASAPARSRPNPKPTDPNTLKHDLRSHKRTVYH